MSILNERIKQRREALGMSQAELAELLGYSDRSTIAKIEKGINDITQSKIEAFAKVLHTTPAYLMGWENNSSGADDDSYGLVKAQRALTKAIEQSSYLPSKERINLLFDASDYDPMVVAFNLDFDQDYLTRWMAYGDIPPAPIVNKVLGVFQIKPKDLFDARDLEAYEDEQDETTVVIPAEASFTESLGVRVRATTRVRIDAALDQMTPEGQSRVADYAEDILLRYKVGEDLQNGGESAPAPQDGQSPAPPPDAAETPLEDK